MRRILTVGVIFSLTLSSLVYAQPPKGPPGKGAPTTRPAQGERPVGRPPGGGGGGQHPGRPPGGGSGQHPGRPPGGGSGQHPGRPPGGGNGQHPPHHGNLPPTKPVPRPPNPGYRPPSHGWRPGGPANPWHRPTSSSWYWHGSWVRRVHASPYRYPPGWAYRRWTAGAVLPGLFLTSLYFYSDWATLDLPAPPPGYQWVRYGPDLLLVQLGTGQVVDVAYGVFL
jgi:Ni/Co efflux regulator RcnB